MLALLVHLLAETLVARALLSLEAIHGFLQILWDRRGLRNSMSQDGLRSGVDFKDGSATGARQVVEVLTHFSIVSHECDCDRRVRLR